MPGAPRAIQLSKLCLYTPPTRCTSRCGGRRGSSRLGRGHRLQTSVSAPAAGLAFREEATRRKDSASRSRSPWEGAAALLLPSLTWPLPPGGHEQGTLDWVGGGKRGLLYRPPAPQAASRGTLGTGRSSGVKAGGGVARAPSSLPSRTHIVHDFRRVPPSLLGKRGRLEVGKQGPQAGGGLQRPHTQAARRPPSSLLQPRPAPGPLSSASAPAP